MASETMKMVNDTSHVTFTNTPQFQAIPPAYNAYFAVLNKDTYSGMGKDVQSADERRDILFTGLYEIVMGMSSFDNEVPICDEAKKLLPFFEKTQKERSVDKKTYAQETSHWNVFTKI